MKILKIGTMVYAVNKALKLHAKVLPARIIGYQNIDGKVYPIIRLVGGKEVSPIHNQVFYDLEKAVEHITK